MRTAWWLDWVAKMVMICCFGGQGLTFVHHHLSHNPPLFFFTGNSLCGAAADTVVPIPVGDGYISAVKIAVAKRGPPYVGQLIISVTPRGGGAANTYSCGSAGGVPVSLMSVKQSLALYNFKAGCSAAPQAAGRRRLAGSATVLDVNSIAFEAIALQPGAAVPTLLLNSVPAAGPVGPTPTPAPAPPSAPTVTQNVANYLGTTSTTLVITGTGFSSNAAGNTVQLNSGAYTIASATSTTLTLTFTSPPSLGPLTAVVTANGLSSGAPVQVATVVTFAYVANYGNNAGTTVSACVAAGGTLTNCAPTGTFSGPIDIAFAGGIAYVVNFAADTVSTCSVSGSTFSNCAVVTSGLNDPTGIAISNGYVYVTERGSNSVRACPITGSTLGTCTTAASGFNLPYQIAISGGWAFVANYGDNTVRSCPVSGASFGSCGTAASGFSNPAGLSIVNGLAYVGNVLSSSVSACTVSGGTLANCNVNYNIAGGYAVTVAGGYAYVGGGSSVIVCAVSGAMLSSCAPSGSGFQRPWGTALLP
jgi:IPT/TIG domain